MSDTTVQADFVGGPLDGTGCRLPMAQAVMELLVEDRSVYGCLDVCITKDDVYVVYGHIEDL